MHTTKIQATLPKGSISTHTMQPPPCSLTCPLVSPTPTLTPHCTHHCLLAGADAFDTWGKVYPDVPPASSWRRGCFHPAQGVYVCEAVVQSEGLPPPPSPPASGASWQSACAWCVSLGEGPGGWRGMTAWLAMITTGWCPPRHTQQMTWHSVTRGFNHSI
jgi:hypothetical protein